MSGSIGAVMTTRVTKENVMGSYCNITVEH